MSRSCAAWRLETGRRTITAYFAQSPASPPKR
nr:MAG TPA: hypothetical protein [Caudoviricetes sp.]